MVGGVNGWNNDGVISPPPPLARSVWSEVEIRRTYLNESAAPFRPACHGR